MSTYWKIHRRANRSSRGRHAWDRAARAWWAADGLIWLHLCKTVTAGLMAMGIAMLLDLAQPRIAMTTVFVLMQPQSGMVFAKSVYRVLGTAAGMAAALVLGALGSQVAEIYLLGLTGWVAACTGAAMRNRHFRWYGCVLAGYTAALIGVPLVNQPGSLLLGALGRGAEVMVGIACSAAVSALILPQRLDTAVNRTLRNRFANFTGFAAEVLAGRLERRAFEHRFAGLVDEIVGLETARAVSVFENPMIRAGSAHLARLNSEFMDACARLHVLHQLAARLGRAAQPLVPLLPYFQALSAVLAEPAKAGESDAQRASRMAQALRAFQAYLPRQVRALRGGLDSAAAGVLLDFDTSAEMLYRLTLACVRYSETWAAYALRPDARETSVTPYVHRTSWFVVAFAFVRTALVMGATGWFWVASDWPSGGFALISAAVVCSLASATPDASRLAMQMAAGAAVSTLLAYVYCCYVYPNIDGFPLLCAVMAPVMALGAFLATRRDWSGFGVGFSVFFFLLGGPDNVVVYAPDALINNGLAVAVAMLIASLGFSVVLPSRMSWLVARMCAALRAQVQLACDDELSGLAQRFQSGTHDLMYQLRLLLAGRARQHRYALRWMLSTLEIGQAVIDLRTEAHAARYIDALDARWPTCVAQVRADLARLFARPGQAGLERALDSIESATEVAQSVLERVHAGREQRHDLARLIGFLHVLRSALIDRQAPFAAFARTLGR